MFENINTDNLKSFPVEVDVNQGTMYPKLRKFCSCGQQIGYFQSYIESEIGKAVKKNKDSSLSKSKKLELARRSFMKKHAVVKICCLRSLMVYPFLTYNDLSGKQSFFDITKRTISNKKSDVEGFARKNVFSKRITNETVGYFRLTDNFNVDFNSYHEKLRRICLGDVQYDEEVDEHDVGKLYFPVNQASERVHKFIKTTIPTPFQEKNED